jgi:prepilin peptidase CpaA
MTSAPDFALLVAAFMAVCAVVDFRTRRIPNWLTVPAAAMGLLYHTLAPHGIGPLLALAGFAVGFSLLLLPWLLGGGGMGDVKMLAALGAWLGPLGILIAFGLGAVVAAVAAIGMMTSTMLWSGYSATRNRYVGASAAASGPSSRRARRILPFAVPMAIGAWLLLAWLLLAPAIS